MKSEELMKYILRVKKRVGVLRYRIYRISRKSEDRKKGRWRLACLGFIEGKFYSFDEAYKALQQKLKIKHDSGTHPIEPCYSHGIVNCQTCMFSTGDIS